MFYDGYHFFGNAPYMVVCLAYASRLDICHPMGHTGTAMEDILSA
jgi:hypothetical protein